MTRLCERPGCSQRAQLLYGIDADHLTVWIVSIADASNVRAGVLCRQHADAMVVPLGWMLDDQREPVPQLFKAPPAVPSMPAPRTRRARPARVEAQAQQLSLGDDMSSTVAAEEVADGDTPNAPTQADPDVQPWAPVFDQADDLDGLLGARGPLLSRAFRGAERPSRGD